MKLRQKIIVLAIAPLIVALIAIALAVQYQATIPQSSSVRPLKPLI
jgi:two-component system, NarL family, sensor kinase